ncbi:zinc finger CCCH domain-containing protein 41-like isoform X2 [Cynara cardunculus var. scolymus]|uniref:zinc finger CCCH domain-containing protein 41-like isoform X2 n=1 Tax=Cynara cardunculus var. scolymus TaxID=59895 RepID=UPI000D62851E|nr:zinc finger CCCH domain-containing protein 41-like isoform X2 [Cynara cardunculus var. scolymus]
MELRVSAQEPGMSPSVYKSHPDDKEISDEDDDDRNHKHRRREDARSQSLEDDAMEQVFTKPYRRGSKPFQNGHLFGETGSQSNETWKKYSFNPLEKDISAKFDQKRPGFTQFSRGPLDLNQKIRVNQPFSGDPGAVRGRGRDSGFWNQRDPRFSSIDIASHIVQQGSVPHSLFAGRGLPTVSNSCGPSWSAFGLVPGMPNGGLDMLHPLGLQGTFRPAMSPLNMGHSRQRCRDFEEQGFCLRGDMCPMEHGVNRIVVEDVQSLSQFNLPVSLASANLSIAPLGIGPSPATSVATSTLSNSRSSHGKNIKCEMVNNGLDASGTFTDSAAAADFYDPDQPLWGNDSHASTRPQSISQPNVGKRSIGGTAVGSLTTSSLRGRISSTKKRTEMRDDMVSKASPSDFMHSEMTGSPVPPNSAQDPHHQKRNNSDSSLKMQSGNGRMLRRPSQKAQRTLFVNGIPQQNNRRESLLSHFRKFGEVINIYIPLNSERAFVQFSKREEAEAALLAPDAVMGNRFIKLWWANRDNIPDVETIGGHNMSLPPHGQTVSTVSPYISVAYKRKDDPRSASHNGINTPVPVSASDQPKPVVANGAKVPPPLQKKLESLEVLKEELRKKQEMLDQKRNDFRRKLDKLEKQATGLKGEVSPEQVAKKQKLGFLSDSTKAGTPSSSDHHTVLPSPQDEVLANSSKSIDPFGLQNSRTTLASEPQESSSLKSSLLPMAHVGSTVVTNRFKLDNRPTAFKIIPPLPDGLAEAPVLKEHFSPYGDLSKVQLEDVDPTTEGNAVLPKTSKASARIYFTTRHAAEKAFINGKSWKGHNLQFVWLNSNKDVSRETPSPTSKASYDSSTKPVVETSKTTPQEPSGNGESEKNGREIVVK